MDNHQSHSWGKWARTEPLLEMRSGNELTGDLENVLCNRKKRDRGGGRDVGEGSRGGGEGRTHWHADQSRRWGVLTQTDAWAKDSFHEGTESAGFRLILSRDRLLKAEAVCTGR